MWAGGEEGGSKKQHKKNFIFFLATTAENRGPAREELAKFLLPRAAAPGAPGKFWELFLFLFLAENYMVHDIVYNCVYVFTWLYFDSVSILLAVIMQYNWGAYLKVWRF